MSSLETPQAEACAGRVPLDFALTSHLMRELAGACRRFLAALEEAQEAQAAPQQAIARGARPGRLPEPVRRPRPTFPGGTPAAEGDGLRRMRETLGLSQRDVAMATGYSRGLVADLESGRRQSPYAREAVSQALVVLRQGEKRLREINGGPAGVSPTAAPVRLAGEQPPASPARRDVPCEVEP